MHWESAGCLSRMRSRPTPSTDKAQRTGRGLAAMAVAVAVAENHGAGKSECAAVVQVRQKGSGRPDVVVRRQRGFRRQPAPATRPLKVSPAPWTCRAQRRLYEVRIYARKMQALFSAQSADVQRSRCLSKQHCWGGCCQSHPNARITRNLARPQRWRYAECRNNSRSPRHARYFFTLAMASPWLATSLTPALAYSRYISPSASGSTALVASSTTTAWNPSFVASSAVYRTQ